ncbi:2-methylcitrate dehydratase [Helicobacter felis]|uniref:2-methylcitrate dehydratase n=1 Tax=Helicobacter felis (strain ATCC 49179 / CCUG 28539 / NCTC 12436 / CS1) TaxID=936155 RepID=E7AAV5_HELFC|nr:2-methylcitrate dehydratase [Helicobacter felis]CBY83567.1 2-methylcitrate dehydratase (EC 4.2.1.79) [Helicobacter felis ATCC 49179]
MSNMGILENVKPDFDPLLSTLARFVLDYEIASPLAYESARLSFIDSIACMLFALKHPECTKLLGPSVPGADFKPLGSKVPGTSYQLEPVRAAFNVGCMVRWLDFNDTWLAKEWGHPSDNLGAIWALGDYLSRLHRTQGKIPLKVKNILTAMIKAHEIQGVLALGNCFNVEGLDHVLLVRIASTAVATGMLGGSFEEVRNAISNAFVDGGSLRCYRHAPNAGSRKSWAAGDASSRGVDLALKAFSGEMGYPSVLSAAYWGYQDVYMKNQNERGEVLHLPQELGSYVMENVLFKISFPAEFHAQTAVECALKLHLQVQDRLEEIAKIEITTQESGHRIINKTGPLHNYADRDHCIQYMVVYALIYGGLDDRSYSDACANDPRIDTLRELCEVNVDDRYTKEYLDPDKRSIANAVQIYFKDGSCTEKIEVHYPIGHKKRRAEGTPLLYDKFKRAVHGVYAPKRAKQIEEIVFHEKALLDMDFDSFSDLFAF